MLFCTKRFYCFVYSEKEKQMQKIREKLEAKQLKKARLVSFVNKRCFFFTVTQPRSQGSRLCEWERTLGTRLTVTGLYFLIMQYFLTFYFRALEAKLYQEKEEQKSKAAK